VSTGAAEVNAVDGGGITFFENLGGGSVFSLERTVIRDNDASLIGSGYVHGGGVFGRTATGADLVVTLLDVVVEGNVAYAEASTGQSAFVQGGGVYLIAKGTTQPRLTVNVARTALVNNKAQVLRRAGSLDSHAQGGAAYIETGSGADEVVFHAVNTTVSGNSALDGTGFGRGGGLTLRRSGTADLTASIANVTVTENRATTAGGGIHLSSTTPFAFTSLQSIVAANLSDTLRDCDNDGGLVVSSFNLFGQAACRGGVTAGDVISSSPALAPIAENGGFAPSHALLPESPALDGGPTIGCVEHIGRTVDTDQRGLPRPQRGRCDIGAFEAQAE